MLRKYLIYKMLNCGAGALRKIDIRIWLLLHYNNIAMTDILSLVPKTKKNATLLTRFYDPTIPFELSIDEAGRGCLFGRVYIACVVLPKEPSLFDGKDVKDSKKFSSKKKLNDVANYIKEHALAWHIAYEEPKLVDDINILQAVMRGMHSCIRETIVKLNLKLGKTHSFDDFMAVIDGNYFTPFRTYNEEQKCIVELRSETIEQGDAKYMAIAAASILAKTARDNHVLELCEKYPFLDEHYGLSKNMGYGTKLHLDGIREHGITRYHRRTFGCCKEASLNQQDDLIDDESTFKDT
jgi:ribonuclease HII